MNGSGFFLKTMNMVSPSSATFDQVKAHAHQADAWVWLSLKIFREIKCQFIINVKSSFVAVPGTDTSVKSIRTLEHEQQFWQTSDESYYRENCNGKVPDSKDFFETKRFSVTHETLYTDNNDRVNHTNVY